MEYCTVNMENKMVKKLRILTLICLVLLITVKGELVCDTNVAPTSCTVSSDKDIQAIPSNVTNLHVKIQAGNSVVLENGVFPSLLYCTKLTIDLRYEHEIKDGAFRELTQLTTLILTNSDIYRPHNPKTLYSGSMEGLSQLTWFEAVDVGLKIVQDQALKHLVKLAYLNWSVNDLNSLDANTFQNNTLLNMLNLNSNNLTTLPSGLFHELSSLLSLDLSNNRMTALPTQAFYGASKLSELDLSLNQLTHFSADTFVGLDTLITLKINNNKVQSISSGNFKGLNKVESLDLSFNSIDSIEDGSFSDLGKLQYIELYNNTLTIITSGTFSGLHSLIYMDIYNNNIKIIEEMAFKDSADLTGLHLHNNNLVQVQKTTFSNLHNIIVLTLHENSLESLPEGVFDDLTSLKLLDMSFNPWACTACDLVWFWPWMQNQIQKNSFQLSQWQNTLCQSPASEAGTHLVQYLNESYYPCFPTTLDPTTTESPPMTTEQLTTTPEPTSTTKGVVKTEAVIVDITEVSTTSIINVTDIVIITGVGDLSNSLKAGIIAACILIALVIIAATVLGIYCRHKKYAFWVPEQPPKPKDAEQAAQIRREKISVNARQKHGSFYQDPETGDITHMMLNSDARKKIRESIQENQYTFNNADMDTIFADSNANKVVAPEDITDQPKETGINNITDDDKIAKYIVESENDKDDKTSVASSTDSVFENRHVCNSMSNHDKKLVTNPAGGDLPSENKGIENFAYESSGSEKTSLNEDVRVIKVAQADTSFSEKNTDQPGMVQNQLGMEYDQHSMEMSDAIKSAPNLSMHSDLNCHTDQQGASSDTEVDYVPEVDTTDIMAEVDAAMKRHSSIISDSDLHFDSMDQSEHPDIHNKSNITNELSHQYDIDKGVTENHHSSEQSDSDKHLNYQDPSTYSGSSTDDIASSEDLEHFNSVMHIHV